MINLVFTKQNEDLIPMLDSRIKKELRNYQVDEQTNIIIYDDNFCGWDYRLGDKYLFFSNELFRQFYKHFGNHRLNNTFLLLEEKRIDNHLFTRSSTSSYKNDIYLKIHRIILRIISGGDEVFYDPFNILSEGMHGKCNLKKRSKNTELLDLSRAAISFTYEDMSIDPLFITLNTMMLGSENIINSKAEYYVCYEEITHDIILISPRESLFIESLEHYYPHQEDQQKIIGLLSTVYYDYMF